MSFLTAAQASFPNISSLVFAGAGFQLLAAGSLIQGGDQYCTAGGQFVPVAQEEVGQPVPNGSAVRRANR